MDLPSSGKPKEFAFFPMRNFKPYRPTVPKLPLEEPDTEFKRKFPPDAELGQELADNARVWQVYRDQAIQHDDVLLSGWNNTIDILLTFAGLFSAAVTAFVIESYQFLQPAELDLGLALYALAINDTATLRSFAASPSSPSPSAQWINGLWFTSLFFSLAAAFLCILVKQWLHEYTARTRASSRSPKYWSRRRAFYFRAIDAWGVPVIISLLPLLLHTALFLFFAGVVVLLWSLNRPMAAWLSSLALLAVILYALALVVSICYDACPFATPFGKQLSASGNSLLIWIYRQGGFLAEEVAAVINRLRCFWSHQPSPGAPCPHPLSIQLWMSSKARHTARQRTAFDRSVYVESFHSNSVGDPVLTLADHLDRDMLCWLILSVPDHDASAVGYQALGALELGSPLAHALINAGINHTSNQRRLSSSGSPSPAEVTRILRSMFFLRVLDPMDTAPSLLFHLYPNNGFIYYECMARDYSYPDTHLLLHALMTPMAGSKIDDDSFYTAIRDAPDDWALSPSLHSTCLLLSTLPVMRQHHILLFLLHCDLQRVSCAQWKLVMPSLWGTVGPCPQHGRDLTDCRLGCLPELVSRLILESNLDGLVLRRLWDKACALETATLSHSPTFLRYIASEKFLDHMHSENVILAVLLQFDRPPDWGPARPKLGLELIAAVRYLLHSALRSGHQTHVPSKFLTLELSVVDDNTLYHGGFITRRPCAMHILPEDALVAILLASESQTYSIPSLWQFLSNEYNFWHAVSYIPALDVITGSLCSLSRFRNRSQQLLVDALFEVMPFRITISNLRSFADWFTSENYPLGDGALKSQMSPRDTVGRTCAHLMELCPSWWTQGMEQLMHEVPTDEDLQRTQSFAEEIMAEALAGGPCSDCPPSSTSLAFDISLREFKLFPFAVYPLVDRDSDPA